MKKLITGIVLFSVIAAFSFAAPKNTKVDLSQKIDSIVLNYNEWGTIEYSRWQSDAIDITDLFKGKLPQEGDVLNFVWNGTTDKNLKKLHILIVDIDENSRWLHLLSEEKRATPVTTNIAANTVFEFSADITLDFSPKTNVKIFFSCGERDTTGESNQKPYEMYGVKLGSHTWQSSISENVITWEKGYDNADAGWDFSGIDMSPYDRVRVEIESTEAPVSLRIVDKDWKSNFGFGAIGKNVFEAKLTGEGSWDKDIALIDPSKGFRIYLNQWNDNVPRSEDKKTVVKSLQFLYPDEYVDAGPLSLYGRGFGGREERCEVQGNTIFWKKGSKDANAGWKLSGINLSEYNSVRLTLEKTDTDVNFYVASADGGNWKHARLIAPNTYEMKLTGEGSDSNEPLLDPSQGLTFIVSIWKDKPLKKDMKTVVKSIELIKEENSINENLMLEGVEFGSSSWHSYVSDGGVIEWVADGKEKYPSAGWNFRDVDLSAYKGIRIEVESTKTPLDIRLIQGEGNECHIGFNQPKPGVLEANFDGSDFNWSWPQGVKWNPEVAVKEIHIRACNLTKKGVKTVIKSVTLIPKEEAGVEVPENLILNGSKLGSQRTKSWIGEDFAIIWDKANWSECGWKVEKLNGEIIEIKVASSEVPLRLRIRDSNYKSGISWADDGSHVFRINLKTKKQINNKGGQVDPEWQEISKTTDYTKGCIICLEPVNGVYKDGKKTVVEYIKVE